ncbi:MAG: hypothetical protein JWM42_2492, partial [Burkholderia sp.]|nr:hypothetical protein [Burkholderia sp.]
IHILRNDSDTFDQSLQSGDRPMPGSSVLHAPGRSAIPSRTKALYKDTALSFLSHATFLSILRSQFGFDRDASDRA